MATAFRLPMASRLPCSSSSSASLKRRSFRSRCSVNIRCSAKGPLPPFNPQDPFLKKLASVAASNPELLLNRPANSDSPPFFDDVYDMPMLMATPAQLERSVSYNEHRPRRPPPDLPSILLDGRIVYIGMPLVPAVTELVLAELMYLQYMDPSEPIYLYINSTGTARDDGEPVAMETEGFAIYDALMTMRCPIYTLAIGNAIGQACLLLACGTKGKRFMMESAQIMIQQPRVPPSGLMQASDVFIQAKEAIIRRDMLVELLARHTGNPVQTVAKAMERPFYLDKTSAIEFGVVDKILRSSKESNEKIMSDVAAPEDWDKGAGIRPADPF